MPSELLTQLNVQRKPGNFNTIKIYYMSVFCLVVELEQGGCVINGGTL